MPLITADGQLISQANGSNIAELGKRLRAKEPSNSVCRGSSFLGRWGDPP